MQLYKEKQNLVDPLSRKSNKDVRRKREKNWNETVQRKTKILLIPCQEK